MERKGFKLTVEEAKKYAADAGAVASHVAALLKSDGWKIFLALFIHKQREIKEKDDYTTLEAFQADRKAITIVKEIFNELETYIDDATEATDILQKLIEAESQTPGSLHIEAEQAPEQG